MSSSSASGGPAVGPPPGGGNPNPVVQPVGGQPPTIDQLIDEANKQLTSITNAFGPNGVNLTSVITRNTSINVELDKIYAIVGEFDAQINNLIEQLSNSKTDEEFNELGQNLQTAYTELDTKIRNFLTNFNTIIPTLGVSRLNANTSLEELNKATAIVTNIRNKAFAYVRKGPEFPANANAEFTANKILVNGIYTREGDGLTFKNNNNDTRISFGIDRGVLVPSTVIINGTSNQVRQTLQGFTTNITGNPYFLLAYAFQNIPVFNPPQKPPPQNPPPQNPPPGGNQGSSSSSSSGGNPSAISQIAGPLGSKAVSYPNPGLPNPGGGSKRKRRRTRKNKRKSKSKKQKGGFNYNNKIPSSNKKKTSKRRTSTRTSTTSTSSSK